MFIIKYRKIFFAISIILVLASWGAIGYYGLNLGTDFRGGSILEVEYPESRPVVADLRVVLSQAGWANLSLQPAGERGLLLRAPTLSQAEKEQVLAVLSDKGAKPVDQVLA